MLEWSSILMVETPMLTKTGVIGGTPSPQIFDDFCLFPNEQSSWRPEILNLPPQIKNLQADLSGRNGICHKVVKQGSLTGEQLTALQTWAPGPANSSTAILYRFFPLQFWVWSTDPIRVHLSFEDFWKIGFVEIPLSFWPQDSCVLAVSGCEPEEP